ncbi:glycosyltransferase, partial [Nocardia tenerifensis]
MIGYYIHHHGSGHLVRAQSIRAHLSAPVTALSTATVTGFDHVIRLAPDNRAESVTDPTAAGVLHWVPRGDDGLRDRMATIAEWIATARPDALVVDVSVEVALLARLHGVPVVAMALPGTRTDTAHQLVHRIAERILAAWPRELYEPPWLREHAHKTHYAGGISRFDGRVPTRAARADRPTVLVLGGAGGSTFTGAQVRACADRHRDYRWRTAGLDDWVDDPWSRLCAADVVVSHAGQGAVADIAAAAKPAIILPAPRPFDEQAATA